MRNRLGRWMNRLQAYFFGDESASVNEEKRSKEEAPAKSSSRGRVPHSESQGVKMTYQYPKKGAFRFPLDVDDPTYKKKSAESRQYQAHSPASSPATNESSTYSAAREPSESKQKKNASTSKELLATVDQHSPSRSTPFVPQEIPSPIHGFRTPAKDTEKEQVTFMEEEPEEEVAEELEERLTEPAEKAEHPTPVEEEVLNQAREKEDPDNGLPYSEPVYDESSSAGTETYFKQTETDMNMDDAQPERMAATVKPVHEFEPVSSQEPELDSEPEPEPEPLTPVRKKINSSDSVMDSKSEELSSYPAGGQPASERENETTEKASGKKRLSHQERKKQRAAQKQDTEGTAQQNVPFNVMMEPKDQAKYQKQKRMEALKHSSQEPAPYQKPSLARLNKPAPKAEHDENELEQQRELLETTLAHFNVKAEVQHVTRGPAVTRFEIQPAPGVKVSKITNLTDDLKLALAAKDLRMEAPIPGKNLIGVEVPNPSSTPVFLREILAKDVFRKHDSPLAVAMGLDIAGDPVVCDLQKMPHGLIAGATGSGKSVCINSILLSLLYKADPTDVKMLLIDPKMVELAAYHDVPHLASPVITDAKEATAALKWAVSEMEDRYERLAHAGVRDIHRFNQLKTENGECADKMPYLLIVIDELADLMMVSAQEVEDSICRIAQKARACGIHLLVATQRPSVDVITGLIKANIPTRVAFAVSSQADSRTILDSGGAERLIGKGDMLYHPNGSSQSIRVQGTFVNDDEIEAVARDVKSQRKPEFLLQRSTLTQQVDASGKKEDEDDLFDEACQFVIEQDGASSSLLQRHFHIGFNRAARLIDMMASRGIISEANGTKPRQVLVTKESLERTEEILSSDE
ncbi:DNA translocase FtsK [Salsuginibacillus kocurii]|uniref:DNA translocase FtsK n=1 Tax=Salsuginibacillus kocurii TaxID=427078 RepID=UPI0003617488|nr:DNA translocase FtsK [Salsuginibacillus kocurii]